MQFEIPRKFNIISQEINTQYFDDLAVYQNSLGQARFNVNIVALQKHSAAYPVAVGQQKHTFCHEVVHHWLRALGEEELCDNETFVDLMGNLLLQFLETMES